MTAEEAEVRSICEWAKEPRVVAPGNAPLLFVAPSRIGTVSEILDATATAPRRVFVRFKYKNPTGGMGWSDPIEVVSGQECSLISPSDC